MVLELVHLMKNKYSKIFGVIILALSASKASDTCSACLSPSVSVMFQSSPKAIRNNLQSTPKIGVRKKIRVVEEEGKVEQE